jgi:hypothetical protein
MTPKTLDDLALSPRQSTIFSNLVAHFASLTIGSPITLLLDVEVREISPGLHHVDITSHGKTVTSVCTRDFGESFIRACAKAQLNFIPVMRCAPNYREWIWHELPEGKLGAFQLFHESGLFTQYPDQEFHHSSGAVAKTISALISTLTYNTKL